MKNVFCALLGFLLTGLLLPASLKGADVDPLAPSTLVGADGKNLPVLKCYPEGRMKAYCVSFDDGTLPTDSKAIAILNKYGLKATFFINSQHPQSQEALQNPTVYQGHEIASHGAHHQGLDHLSLAEAQQEVATDQRILGETFHCKVEGFAYPYGALPKTEEGRKAVEAMLASLGIRYARWTGGGSFQPPDNFLAWKPKGGFDLGNARQLVNLPSSDQIQLLTDWGHSRDLEKAQRWDKFDELCKFLVDSKSVWVATYLQITSYIEALRAVKIENGEINNASSETVWVRVGETNVSISPGQHWRPDGNSPK